MEKAGQWAEKEAASYLKKQGLKIVSTNFSASGGEVDIIARDKDTLVFVEVRFRQSARFGTARETINKTKQQKIIKAASGYLQQHNLWDKIACRFDTVCITGNPPPQNASHLLWEKNAFEL